MGGVQWREGEGMGGLGNVCEGIVGWMNGDDGLSWVIGLEMRMEMGIDSREVDGWFCYL